jgi:diguanylate cyclase (GGDEF)-like protein/putative nucleotidyltransferase with HDIG domain
VSQLKLRDRPLLAQLYIGAVIILGLGVLAASLLLYRPADLREWVALPVFLVLAFLAGMQRVPLTARLGTMSVGFALVAATIVSLGPYPGVVAAALSALGQAILTPKGRARLLPHQIIFAIATLSTTAGLAGLVYLSAGGEVLGAGGAAPSFTWSVVTPSVILAAAAAASTYYLVNTWLVAIVVALSERKSPFRLWHDNLLWTAPGYYAGWAVGMTAATIAAWARSNVEYLPLLLIAAPILYVIWYSYKIHMAKRNADADHIEQLARLYLSTIQSLAMAIDAKDHYSHRHIDRVQRLAGDVARELGIDGDELQAIETGALLHDVGKLGVPDHILNTPSKLTDEERQKIQRHPDVGAEIIQPIEFPWPVVDLVRHHHECWDGSGYPDGLKGEDIPFGARILAVVEVYDALTSERAYRRAWTHEGALEYITANRGAKFDPEIVHAFLEVMQRREASPPEEAGRRAGEPADEAAAERAEQVATIVRDIAAANRELFALYEISRTIGKSLSLDETLRLVAGKVDKIVQFSACAIFLLDPELEEIDARVVVGEHCEPLVRLRLPLGAGISGRVAQHGQPILNGRASLDFERSAADNGQNKLASVLSVPLISDENEMIGVISLYHEQGRAFTSDDLRLLVMVAHQAAAAIRNARVFEETRESALTDMLTSLPNNRYFFMCMAQELARAQRRREPVSLLTVDLDSLKSVNDSFGHAQGDRALMWAARLLRASVRASDTVVRYAGDEFLVVLPNTPQDGAREIAERIRQGAETEPLEVRPGKFIHLSMSVGTATFPEDGLDVDDLVRAADEEMYAHKSAYKRGGRGWLEPTR